METSRVSSTLSLPQLLNDLDPTTRDRIDTANRARVQRAWEVLTTTGQGLAAWQDSTPPPRLPLGSCLPILLEAPRDWLTPRISRRFDLMLSGGAMEEAREMLPHWPSAAPAFKAIGAPELMRHLTGELSLDAATAAAIIATRQYAKRQRTYFRKQMRDWHHIPLPSTDLSTAIHFAD